MKILFKNARILTMVDEKIIDADLLVIDSRIAYIGDSAHKYTPFDLVIDCQKKLLMPGFKNAHTHSAMIFLRNRFKDVSLQDWLFKCIFPREDKLIPSDIYYLNKACILEYLANGTTACFDQYFFPLEGGKAADEIGFRMLLLAIFNAETTNVDDLERNYHYFNDRKEGFARYAIGVHAEYTSNQEMIENTRQAINRLKCPFFTHISETKKEVEECIGRHNKTPLKYLFDEGLFKYGGGGYHCIYFTDEEIKICKDNNLTIVSCPGSNLYLESGIAPLTKYLNHGIRVALGTDGPASNESLDMFREMRLAGTREGKYIPSFELLKMATVNGAYAMGLKDADVLAVDKLADIIMVDVNLSKDHPLDDIVYKCNQDNVKLTMINGNILYEDGQYRLKESQEDIYKKVKEISERIENEYKKDLK